MKKLADNKAKHQQLPFFSGARLHYALISLLTLVLYINSLKNSLVNIYNPGIKSILAKPLPTDFFDVFTTQPQLGHFICIVIYAFTGAAFYNFLRRCLNNQNAWLPLLSTILFIAYPAHTEVVNNIANSTIQLSLLFSLVACRAFLRYVDENNRIQLVLGFGMFCMALLLNTNCWAFVAIAPLAIYYFRANKSAAITTGSGLLALTLAYYIIVAVLVPLTGREMLFTENPLVAEPGIGIHVASVFYWLSHYIRLLILPYPLASFYGYNQLPPTTFANPLAILSLLLHIGLLGYALWGLKKRSLLSFAAWVYLFGIIIYSNLFAPVYGIVGERFLYIGSIGFCIAMAYAIISLAKLNTLPAMPLKTNTVAMGMLALFLIPYSAITISRNSDWKDALTLFRHDVKVVNNSAKAHGELAMELRRQFKRLPNGNPNRAKLAAEAAEHFDRSIKIYPKNNEYRNLLGSIYLFEEHNPAKALPELRLAVANSKNPSVKYLLDLANCYQVQEPRQLDSAEKYFLKVLDADSVHIQAHYQLAKNSYLKGDTTAAKNINRRFLKLHPDNPLPYRNQGDFYLIEGDTLKAREWYKKEKYYQDRLVTKPKQTDEE